MNKYQIIEKIFAQGFTDEEAIKTILVNNMCIYQDGGVRLDSDGAVDQIKEWHEAKKKEDFVQKLKYLKNKRR